MAEYTVQFCVDLSMEVTTDNIDDYPNSFAEAYSIDEVRELIHRLVDSCGFNIHFDSAYDEDGEWTEMHGDVLYEDAPANVVEFPGNFSIEA